MERWLRTLERWTSSPTQPAVVLQPRADVEPTRACDVRDRQYVAVSGTVRAASMRSYAGGVPALVADLDDDGSTVLLVWLGQREIAGVEPGRRINARGRVCVDRGNPTIYNPDYDLVAPGRPCLANRRRQ